MAQCQHECPCASVAHSITPIPPPQCSNAWPFPWIQTSFIIFLPTPGASQAASSLTPDDNLLYVLSLPAPSPRLSLYPHAISSATAYFPITSCLIREVLKALLHSAGLPSSTQPQLGHLNPSQPPFTGGHNAQFHSHIPTQFLSHRSSLTADKTSTSDG